MSGKKIELIHPDKFNAIKIARMQEEQASQASKETAKQLEQVRRAQKHVEENLKALQSRLAMGQELTPREMKFIRRTQLERAMKEIGYDFGVPIGLAAGFTLVLNLKLLNSAAGRAVLGEMVGKNMLRAGATEATRRGLVSTGLKKGAGAGASVLLDTAIDLAYLCQGSIGAERLARNAAMNTCTAAGAYGGAELGAAVGALGGPIGAVAGGVIGGLIGGIGSMLVVGSTPLGGMTDDEKAKALAEIKKQFQPELKKMDLEFDDSLSYDQVIEMLKNEKIPAKATKQFAKAAKLSPLQKLHQLEELVGRDTVTSYLLLATSIAPTARLEGLTQIRDAVCNA